MIPSSKSTLIHKKNNHESTLTRRPTPTVKFKGNFDYLNLTASFVESFPSEDGIAWFEKNLQRIGIDTSLGGVESWTSKVTFMALFVVSF